MKETGAVVAIWNGIAEGRLPEFRSWHDGEHMPERLGIAGFQRARRYRAVTGEPQFFTRYDLDAPEVLTSPAYLARLNAPTPRTFEVLPHFRDVFRALCRTRRATGPASGAFLCTLRIEEQPGTAAADRLQQLAPALAVDGLLGLRLLETDRGASAVPTREQRERQGPTLFPHWVILAECRDLAAARAVEVATAPMLAGLSVEAGIYLLECDLQ